MKNQTEVKNLEPVLVTPAQIAERWSWHPESVRRKLRAGSIPSLVIGRRRLVRLMRPAHRHRIIVPIKAHQ